MSIIHEEEALDIRRISPDIQRQMDRLLQEGEFIEFSLPADLSLDGKYNSSALYITNKRMFSFDQTHDNGYLEVEINKVKYADIEQMYGNSIFKIFTDKEEIILNRFTNTVDDLFYNVLDYFRSEDQLTESADTIKSEGAKFRCPKCGRALSKKSSICRHCIDTRAVITRLFSYIKPYKKVATIGIICAVLATAASLVPPYLTRILVDPMC